VMEAEAKQQEIIAKERKRYVVPANTLYLQGGYGLIMSKFYLSDRTKVSPLGGLEWRVEANHTYESGFGFSAIYAGYHRKISSSNAYANLYLHYVAPALTYSYRVDRFIVRLDVGMGLGFYDDGFNQCTNFASNYDFRTEYMISEKIGVNFDMSTIVHTMSKKYQVGNLEPQIGRLSFTTGVQFYF